MQQMWTRCKVCDACRIARATVETESGFFLCDGCEAVVVITFQEFELPSALPWVIEAPPSWRPFHFDLLGSRAV
jgi:hypothetical protein